MATDIDCLSVKSRTLSMVTAKSMSVSSIAEAIPPITIPLKPSSLIYLITFAAQMLSFSFGLTMGFTSIANEELSRNFTSNHRWQSPFYPNDMEKKLIASIWTIGSLISGLISGYLIDRFGRQKVILFLGVIYNLSWFMIGFSRTPIVAIVGRFINGIGVGISMPTIPRFLAEISTPEIRGYIGMTTGLFTVFGMLMINLINVLNVHWNYLALLSTIPTILMMVIMFFMPESPVWLVNFINNPDESIKMAKNSLRKLRTADSDIDKELNELLAEKAHQTTINNQNRSKFESLRRKDTYKPFILSLVMTLLQQFCGSSIIIYSMNDIYHNSGSTLTSKQSSSLTYGIMLITVMVGFYLIENLGRRMLLIMTTLGQALSLIVLGFYYYSHRDCTMQHSILPIICLSVFVSCYSIGPGGICWIIMAEITPAQAVWLVMATGSVLSALGTFIMIMMTTTFFEYLKEYGTYWLFSVINILLSLFAYQFLPETRSKTIEEIAKLLHYYD